MTVFAQLCGRTPAGRDALRNTGPTAPLCPDWRVRWSVDSAPAGTFDPQTYEVDVCAGTARDEHDEITVCTHDCHGGSVLRRPVDASSRPVEQVPVSTLYLVAVGPRVCGGCGEPAGATHANGCIHEPLPRFTIGG